MGLNFYKNFNRYPGYTGFSSMDMPTVIFYELFRFIILCSNDSKYSLPRQTKINNRSRKIFNTFSLRKYYFDNGCAIVKQIQRIFIIVPLRKTMNFIMLPIGK